MKEQSTLPFILLPSSLDSMLRELHISNLAVIADARIELAEGLNCFTGATGAGKSLVIGALEVLLGLRSPAEMLRPGADEGRVSGVFDIDNPDLLKRVERLTDVQVTADGVSNGVGVDVATVAPGLRVATGRGALPPLTVDVRVALAT